MAAIVALAILVTLPRFGHTTPDSEYYVALARYFQGEAARADLHTPFAFRWALPWLASWIPGVAPATAIALCSMLATAAAALCFARLLAGLVQDPAQWRVGMAVLVVSFPTFNYGAAVLTDSAGFLVLAGGAVSLLERRYLALALLAGGGVWVRESTLLLLPVLWCFVLLERDRRGILAAAGITLLTLAAAAGARWWFSDLPAYFWSPSWSRFAANMNRPVSWATLSLTLLPAGALALAGLRNWKIIPRRTRHFILAAALPGLALLGYSTAAAFMSGRFGWPLYLALAPLAAAAFTCRQPPAAGSGE